ncbi:WhiB family transcriptional regulator [Saccharopolyspora sp. ASAGF58]|uniref:WhiB family transcriptional regulator n=1 Tax=Saccharopolyspora sp. ASAGF58 TaxID=2719023 RepID=UPI0021128070|nr:WhiB family transcriptional regulator [Saccharopolyspora sp. ASAGF58]
MHRQGRCVDGIQGEWFPEPARGVDSLSRQRRQAKWACADCPVRTGCLVVALAYEIDEGESWGIWGGVCARDRRQAIRHATQHPGRRPDAIRVARQLLETLDAGEAREESELVPPTEFDQDSAAVGAAERHRHPNERIA